MKIMEKIKNFWKWYMHTNYLKVNGGVDPCEHLHKKIAEKDRRIRLAIQMLELGNFDTDTIIIILEKALPQEVEYEDHEKES